MLLLRLIRVALVLLLAAGVPVQGFAAQAGALCGAHGHHAAQTAPNSDALEGVTHAGESGQSSRGKSAPGEALCEACVGCGVAAAITAAPAASSAAIPSGGVTAAHSSFMPGIVPERLDRPPLAVSA